MSFLFSLLSIISPRSKYFTVASDVVIVVAAENFFSGFKRRKGKFVVDFPRRCPSVKHRLENKRDVETRMTSKQIWGLKLKHNKRFL